MWRGMILFLAACGSTPTMQSNHRGDLEFAPLDEDMTVSGEDLAGADLSAVNVDLSSFQGDLSGPDLQTLNDLTAATGDLSGAITSCKALHAASPGLPSGSYTINPTSGALNVYCDMNADGGGWTLVFVPTSDNYFTDLLDYTIPTSSSLWSEATEALLAFRDSSKTMLGSRARFAIPAEWKVKAPFQYVGSDVPVSVSINNGAAENHTLRYGTENFSVNCNDDWMNDQTWGRICITDTLAPFYDGFDHGTATVDGCQTSMDSYNTVDCTSERGFTIAIR